MLAMIEQIAVRYHSVKVSLSTATGAPEDLLHVHAGLLIFVFTALILRKKMRSPVPLALVVFFAVLNEILDWLAGGAQHPGEPFVDIANTVFWPAVLFLTARRWR